MEAPIFLSVPATDKLFMADERTRTTEILTESEQRFNLQIFSNVGHGFAVSVVGEGVP